jgi:hypothetical protein
MGEGVNALFDCQRDEIGTERVDVAGVPDHFGRPISSGDIWPNEYVAVCDVCIRVHGSKQILHFSDIIKWRVGLQ